jgi:hypothetical protein
MFPAGYWPKTYWTGKYWPPSGVVVQIPEGFLEAALADGSLIAVISIADQVGAIISRVGTISARFDINEAEAAWMAAEEPSTATLVRGDLSVVLGQDALAVQMPVLYVGAEIVNDLLKSKLDDEAIISVVSPEGQSVTLKP